MYLSAALRHIRTGTAMGRGFLKNPRALLYFIMYGNVIETDFQRRVYKFLCTKKEYRDWSDFNADVQQMVKEYESKI